jgi:hypothetical protein
MSLAACAPFRTAANDSTPNGGSCMPPDHLCESFDEPGWPTGSPWLVYTSKGGSLAAAPDSRRSSTPNMAAFEVPASGDYAYIAHTFAGQVKSVTCSFSLILDRPLETHVFELAIVTSGSSFGSPSAAVVYLNVKQTPEVELGLVENAGDTPLWNGGLAPSVGLTTPRLTVVAGLADGTLSLDLDGQRGAAGKMPVPVTDNEGVTVKIGLPPSVAGPARVLVDDLVCDVSR